MLNSRRDIVEQYQRKGGGAKNKQLNKEKWARNVKESNREAGLGYVSYSGKEVPSKIFKEVKQCSLENCFLKLPVKDQHCLYQSFYNGQSKTSQDTYLGGCMHLYDGTVRKRLTLNPKINRSNKWKYVLKVDGIEVEVCRSVIVHLLQLSVKRLRGIQDKLLSGETLKKKEGLTQTGLTNWQITFGI